MLNNFSWFLLDEQNENALNNRKFYEFYEKENTEKWLTPEQWDLKEEEKNDKLFHNGTFSRACRLLVEPVSFSRKGIFFH